MIGTGTRHLLTISLLGAWSVCATLRGALAGETALDRYVAKPDRAYSWKIVDASERNGAERFVVALTSQSWRTEAEVDRTLWEHWLVIERPAEVRSRIAFLAIGGGRNRPEPPEGPDELVGRVASETGTVAVELRAVPNQPIVFGGDGRARSEDDIIAYTWNRYLETGDETWPARLPMVKSAVRTMDAVQQWAAQEHGQKIPPIPQLTRPGATSNEPPPLPAHVPMAITEPLFATVQPPAPPVVSIPNGIADAGVANSDRHPAMDSTLISLIIYATSLFSCRTLVHKNEAIFVPGKISEQVQRPDFCTRGNSREIVNIFDSCMARTTLFQVGPAALRLSAQPRNSVTRRMN